MLNFTPLLVALLGMVFLNEHPSIIQWSGSVLFMAGIFIYFIPADLNGSRGIGLIVMAVGVVANSIAAILGRSINRTHEISPLIVTFISMGMGAFLLLAAGLLQNGIPVISPKNWIFLFWLAAVNTAFAFTLWNHTMRTLKAMESSIINGTMLIQIAILAWIFLGEKITLQEGLGMIIAATGAMLVQMKIKSGKQNKNISIKDKISS